jgi:uncharacterized caspase-like protein
MKHFLIVHIWLCVLVSFFITGCASKTVTPSTQATLQTRALQPSAGKAIVYYYNDKRFLGSTSVSLDKLSSHIAKNAYVVWEVEPGKHYLEFYYKGILAHKFGADIACEADRIYYFYLRSVQRLDLPSDDPNRETYEITQADDKTGQANIEQFALSGWFKDGSLVATAEPASTIETPVAEAKPEASKPESKPEESRPIAPQEESFSLQGRYYALVIGIAHYQDWDQLPTPVNDAQAVAKLLQENYGFQVQTLLDQQATREGILDTLNALQKTLQTDDKLLIYYAGHCTVEADTQTAYWLPVEAKRDSDTQWISAETIATDLKRLPANQILVIADSCYSGMLARSTQPDWSSEAKRNGYLKEIATQHARVLMTSGSNNPVTDKAEAERSLFAQAFLDALTNVKPTVFAAEEVFTSSIRETVAGTSKYVPEFGIIRNSGHQGGDFIFKKQK